MPAFDPSALKCATTSRRRGRARVRSIACVVLEGRCKRIILGAGPRQALRAACASAVSSAIDATITLTRPMPRGLRRRRRATEAFSTHRPWPARSETEIAKGTTHSLPGDRVDGFRRGTRCAPSPSYLVVHVRAAPIYREPSRQLGRLWASLSDTSYGRMFPAESPKNSKCFAVGAPRLPASVLLDLSIFRSASRSFSRRLIIICVAGSEKLRPNTGRQLVVVISLKPALCGRPWRVLSSLRASSASSIAFCRRLCASARPLDSLEHRGRLDPDSFRVQRQGLRGQSSCSERFASSFSWSARLAASRAAIGCGSWQGRGAHEKRPACDVGGVVRHTCAA